MSTATTAAEATIQVVRARAREDRRVRGALDAVTGGEAGAAGAGAGSGAGVDAEDAADEGPPDATDDRLQAVPFHQRCFEGS